MFASHSNAPQVRAEGLGAILAGLAIGVPSVHRRLQDALPGRGRKTSSEQAQGSKQAFHLASTLGEEQKQVSLLQLACCVAFRDLLCKEEKP